MTVPKKKKRKSLRVRPKGRARSGLNQTSATIDAGAENRRWQKSLAARAKKGDQKAAAELIDSVDAMIWQQCWRFAHALSRSGRLKVSEEDVQDMRCEARLVLFTHIPSYNPKYAWSTYAVWWIRAAIHRFWNNHGRLVRIPVHLLDNQHLIVKAYNDFIAARGREPSDNEWAAAAGVTRKSLAGVKLAWSQARPLSLDTPIDAGEDDRAVMDVFADESDLAEDDLVEKARDERLRRALRCLPPKERFVLEYRHGFHSASREMQTLEDTADALWAAGLTKKKSDTDTVGRRLTRERVRQIEAKASAALRKILLKMEREE